ncbi:ClpXP protease specificity-enhancing factor SspB, partial [Enterobacter hormaechei]|uniref:ClpXP protease specificity-enhancing factor SspB n=1 Tax=Enterobacter hormaechei TaxID=158836 RepID=UPI00265BB820
FGGVAQSLYIPALAVMAIYARENGQGMVFDLEQPGPVDDEPGDDDGGPSDEPPRPSGRPSLKVVKYAARNEKGDRRIAFFSFAVLQFMYSNSLTIFCTPSTPWA